LWRKNHKAENSSDFSNPEFLKSAFLTEFEKLKFKFFKPKFNAVKGSHQAFPNTEA
jgi:hypothetical protein